MLRSTVGIGVCLSLLAVAQPVGAQAQAQRGSRNVDVVVLEVGTNVSTGDLPDQPVFPGALELPEINSRYHSDVHAALRYQPIAGERINYGINLQSAVRRYETADEF